MPTQSSSQKQQLKIGLLDFEPLRVAGFESVCESMPHVSIISVGLAEALLDRTLQMIMLGLHDPAACFAQIAKLKAAQPSLRLIVMGAETDEETIINAIAAGAKGYLEETATPEQVIMCIDVVASGSIWAPRKILSTFVDRMLNPSENKPVLRHNPSFTKREEEILDLLQAARSNREIASALGIEERTVKSHIAKMVRKAGVGNRVALSVRAANRRKE